MTKMNNGLRFGLLGKGISYSVSPALHGELFHLKGLDNATYEIVDTDCIDDVIAMLRSDFSGFNVTKPYKIDIMRYLDEIDAEAKAIGSVNTVVNRDGKLIGYNTDIDGIVDTFALDGVDLRGKHCLVMGYGGVAKTLVFALSKLGASVINITGRNREKIENFVSDAHAIGVNAGIDLNVSESYDILINATSLGLKLSDKTPIDVCQIGDVEYYFDLIYNPRETLLMKKLRLRGTKCRDGLYMLVSQAAKAQEYYMGFSFEEREKNIVFRHLAGGIFRNRLKSRNLDGVTLIGFMGAGKSTVGRELASAMNVDFMDTDETIENRFGSIKNMFIFHGEAAFREIERAVLVGNIESDAVISTGGGIVMLDENVITMKASNRLNIYLDVPFDVIKERVKGSDRPLFKDVAKAKELYEYRAPRYREVADLVVDGSQSLDAILEEILKF